MKNGLPYSNLPTEQCDQKKLLNFYKSCLKTISLEILMILTPLKNLPNNVGDLGKKIVAKGFEKLSKKSSNLDTLLLRDENISMVGEDYFIHLNCSNIAVNFGTLFDGEITSYFHPPVKRFCTSKVCSKFSVFIRYWRCFRLNFFGKLAKCFCLFSFFSQDKCSTNLTINDKA